MKGSCCSSSLLYTHKRRSSAAPSLSALAFARRAMAAAADFLHPMVKPSGTLLPAILDELAMSAGPAGAVMAGSPLSDLPPDLTKLPSTMMNGVDWDAGTTEDSSSKTQLEPNAPAPMSREKRIRAVKFRCAHISCVSETPA